MGKRLERDEKKWYLFSLYAIFLSLITASASVLLFMATQDQLMPLKFEAQDNI